MTTPQGVVVGEAGRDYTIGRGANKKAFKGGWKYRKSQGMIWVPTPCGVKISN